MLVSGKYREPDSGAWTVPRMFSDGGLSTFMTRWNECGRPNQCRWVTNGGLDIDCRKLRGLCAAGKSSETTQMARDLSGRFNQSADSVAQFLNTLRIDNSGPIVEYARVLGIDQCARTALRELNLVPEGAANAYDAVAGLVRSAAKGLGDSPGRWLMTAPQALDAAWVLQSDVAQRLITREQVIETLRAAVVPAAASLPALTQPATRLVAKLKAGQIVPSAAAAARRARRAWTAYESGISCPLPGTLIGPDFTALRARLTAEATEAQLVACTDGEPYGNAMLADMHKRVAEVAGEQPNSFGLDFRLLMGLVYDLTAHCEIWWSPEFELED